jgi:phenylalanine-4-hydroxylase
MDGRPTLALVSLDRDHPGFRDPVYRSRRNEIAVIATHYQPGDPVPDIEYTAREHGVWATALGYLRALHGRYACREYVEGSRLVRLPDDGIAQLREVNTTLEPLTGFRLSPVAGLVTPRVFLTFLSRRIFLATQYIRHHSAPLYTPEPDVVHELVGHAPLLAHAEVAELHELFGKTAERVPEDRAEALIRVYWYTMEFGLVKEGGDVRAIGAGLLSSYGELGRFEREADIRPLDLDVVAATPFDTSSYQDVLFVAENSEKMFGDLVRWLRTFA